MFIFSIILTCISFILLTILFMCCFTKCYVEEHEKYMKTMYFFVSITIILMYYSPYIEWYIALFLPLLPFSIMLCATKYEIVELFPGLACLLLILSKFYEPVSSLIDSGFLKILASFGIAFVLSYVIKFIFKIRPNHKITNKFNQIEKHYEVKDN